MAFVGQRSMVGSVLDARMTAADDASFANITYFSTSQAGQTREDGAVLADAHDLSALSAFDAVVTTQGSDYTEAVHGELREGGWSGFWIDAASKLRMEPGSIPILDPVNGNTIESRIEKGDRDLIGTNCTVSTMLMGLTPIFTGGHVEWVDDDTYQAASGAGAKPMRELLAQMAVIGMATQEMVDNPAVGILEIDQRAQETLTGEAIPVEQWGGVPLAGNVIPWIDRAVDLGQTREERKGFDETNNILGLTNEDRIVVDGICARVGAMRSHAHALLIKLRQDIPLQDIEQMLTTDAPHPWIKFVPNVETATKNDLTSVSASGDLQVHVGRLHKSKLGPEYLKAFVVGDQLLWGAAEPLRRALKIVADYV